MDEHEVLQAKGNRIDKVAENDDPEEKRGLFPMDRARICYTYHITRMFSAIFYFDLS